MLILTVIQGPDKGKKFELPANEPQLLGRSSEALPLSDTTVSRRHAELTPDEGEWHLRDLNSQNGTYVNGVKITERTRLRLGDQVRTGATLFVFGRTQPGDEVELVRIVRPDQIDSSIEHLLGSNDDSMVLAEPEPRSAAVHHLQVIYRLTALTGHLTDRDDLLRAVMDLVFNELKPERGFIVMLPVAEGGPGAAGSAGEQAADDAGRAGAAARPPGVPTPVVVKHRTPPRDKKDARIHVSRTILQHALRSSEGVLSTNAMNDPRFAKGDSVQQFHIRSAVCSPIEFGDLKFGAIYVDSSMANYTFTPEQLALLNAIGRHTGLALANAEAVRKKLQTERLAAIGETVAALSHSIKNILQGLRGGADVVQMGLNKSDLTIARNGWGILKRNLDRIMALTLNMLAYSRARTLEFELTPIGVLLEDCAALMQGPCDAKRVALMLDIDPEIPPIMLDQHLMHQALVNLLVNAVEAVEPESGAVTVRAAYVPGVSRESAPVTPQPSLAGRSALLVQVIDNGPGIEPARHATIFEPFTTTKGIRGTGLGLAVTRRIVEEHGGHIRVASQSGRGATFTMWIPADAGKADDPSKTATSRAASDPPPTGSG